MYMCYMRVHVDKETTGNKGSYVTRATEPGGQECVCSYLLLLGHRTSNPNVVFDLISMINVWLFVCVLCSIYGWWLCLDFDNTQLCPGPNLLFEFFFVSLDPSLEGSLSCDSPMYVSGCGNIHILHFITHYYFMSIVN